MAVNRPDYEYIEAKKIIDNLGNSKKDKAIKYYIKKHQNWYDEEKRKLVEFEKFFSMLNSFLSRNGNKLF